MDDPKAQAAALLALAKSGDAIRSKTGRLRQLMPSIEALHKLGYPHAHIVGILNEGGLELTLKAYSVYLHRIRAERSAENKPAPVTLPPITDVTPPGEIMQQDEDPQPKAEPKWNETAEEAKRRREERSRQFIGGSDNPLIKSRKG